MYNVSIGVFTITAFQAGNDTYAAATPVQITLKVRPKKPILELDYNAVQLWPDAFQTRVAIQSGGWFVTSHLFYVDDDKSFSSPTIFNFESIQGTMTGLATNKMYYYKVIAHYDNSVFSEPSETRCVVLGSVDINTNGNISSLVENKLVAKKLVINSDLVIDANLNIIVDTLVINNSASVTVNAGSNLEVYSQMVILSNANNETGQILNNGLVSLNSRGVCNVILRKTFNTGKWYFFGLPFNTTTIDRANTSQGATFANRDESVADLYKKVYLGDVRASSGPIASSWSYVADPQMYMDKGYIMWSYNDATYDFGSRSVTQNALAEKLKEYSVSQYPANEPMDMSWNLVNNPYFCSVNLAHTSQGPFYIYNTAQDNYQVVMPGASYNLLPCTAFFIQAQSPKINFSEGGRKLIPNSVTNVYNGYEELNFSIANETYSDLTRVRLKKGASAEYEIGSDAVKMYSMNSNVPQLFSKNKKVEYAVNTMPYETKTFDLFVKAGQTGAYTISLSDLHLAPNCTEVKLIDKENGTETNLLLNHSYNFIISNAGTFNRFKVTVETANDNVLTQIDDTDIGVKLLTDKNTIAFEGLQSSALLRVFDLSGKLLLEYPSIGNGEFVTVPNKGLTILELSTSEKTYKLKTIIQ